jgi:hypothetical protein
LYFDGEVKRDVHTKMTGFWKAVHVSNKKHATTAMRALCRFTVFDEEHAQSVSTRIIAASADNRLAGDRSGKDFGVLHDFPCNATSMGHVNNV